jgi:transcriptional antiterminator NusG
MSSEERSWYVVYTYSGYEQKVKKNIEYRIGTLSMSEYIFRVEIPTVPKKLFSGCVLVQMIPTKDSLFTVEYTPGVTGMEKLDP